MKKILFILAVTTTILISSCAESSKNTGVVKTSWQDATFEQKEQWLKAYLNSPDDEGYELIDKIDTQLKSKFTLPNSVEYNFNESPTFIKAVVTDADNGLVVINGKGKANNSLGVDIPFTYNVQLQIYPDEKKIININVSQ
ncbi:hypothetical protein GGR32_000150 [Mesonia hippocampi]|uniref:Lipoprotein n=1 Tax=Mesonia hippocampi TaxID=1628250 RepID=A0A840EI88_9FLAO|nr:hypothetical protein [Mesonia hippocampi]MBB4117878.1 hypothetical protein [Mesonia hippocampi]